MNNYTSIAETVAAMQLLDKKATPGNEDIADGVKRDERESDWYGKVVDFEELKRAKGFEIQRQSGIKAKNGMVRVRKTTVNGVVSYALTSKAFKGPGERDEVSEKVGESMHEVFMKATGESMDKTRYFFDAGNGLTWEVDIFTDLDGNFKPYCKIDLEYEKRPAEWPQLPIQLTEVIGPDNRTDEQLEFVRQLNSNMFQNKIV